jgi:hypothetical protein
VPRKRRTGKARPALHVERFRTLLKFGHDFFNELGDYSPSREELKQAWRLLGPELMQSFADNPMQRAGKRPYGFWIFDVGLDGRPSDDEQKQYLEQHGLLSEAERHVLAKRAERMKQ